MSVYDHRHLPWQVTVDSVNAKLAEYTQRHEPARIPEQLAARAVTLATRQTVKVPQGCTCEAYPFCEHERKNRDDGLTSRWEQGPGALKPQTPARLEHDRAGSPVRGFAKHG